MTQDKMTACDAMWRLRCHVMPCDACEALQGEGMWWILHKVRWRNCKLCFAMWYYVAQCDAMWRLRCHVIQCDACVARQDDAMWRLTCYVMPCDAMWRKARWRHVMPCDACDALQSEGMWWISHKARWRNCKLCYAVWCYVTQYEAMWRKSRKARWFHVM